MQYSRMIAKDDSERIPKCISM